MWALHRGLDHVRCRGRLAGRLGPKVYMSLHVLQFFFFVLILIMCLCVGVCALRMGAYRGQKTSDPLKPELQVVVSYLRGVLRTELWFSAKAVSTLDGRIASPQLLHL